MFQIKDLHAGLTLVFLIVFNAIFFIVGGTVRTTGEWISYAFIHFSYLMLLLTPRLVNNSSVTSTLGVSVYSISFLYFLISLLIGVIIIFVRPENHIAALVIYIILSGIYFVVLLSSLIANEKTIEAEDLHRQDMMFINNAVSIIKPLVSVCEGTGLGKKMERLYDLIRTSQVKSDSSVWETEDRILDSLNQLAALVSKDKFDESEEKVKGIEKDVQLRNQTLKLIRKT